MNLFDHRGLNLSAAVAASYQSVLSRLEGAAQFALTANRIRKVLPDLDLPAGDVVISIGEKQAEGTVGYFETYCIHYSLIIMMSVCERYLRDVKALACLGVEQSKTSGPVGVDRLNSILDECNRDTSALWKVLESLLEMLGKSRKAIGGRIWFTGLERIRNCLVHRGGMVGDLDLDSKGDLEVVWRRPVLAEPDGAVVTSLPFTAEKGLLFGTIERKLIWKKGEAIVFTVQDCQDMAYSLSDFCSQVNSEVVDGLRGLLRRRER